MMIVIQKSLPAIALLLLAIVAVAAHPVRRSVERTWHDNGQLSEARMYVNGKEEGTHRGWWPNGTPKFEYVYHNGLLDGVSREWFPSGALFREQHYSAGHEAELQRMYWEDGRVRASYVVRDGRRFGLMGAKGCVTRADSLARGL
jgi:antitoxin component YwqK of YwqJK toxin-antitoxin module